MSSTNRPSARSRVLSFLLTGKSLTALTLGKRYNVKHPRSVIAKLRASGYTGITTSKNRRGVAVYSIPSVR